MHKVSNESFENDEVAIPDRSIRECVPILMSEAMYLHVTRKQWIPYVKKNYWS